MCGIAGYWTRGRIDVATIEAMADRLAHRGPDDGGAWIDEAAGIGLGHRRLAIVDLTAAGHQPILSRDGRWAMTFNGEIFNHAALRADLAAAGVGGWRGHGDTETLVEAFACWGVERTVARLVGMFAIGLWDRRERRLHLICDRMGEKPLYYGWVGAGLAFGSELKAVRRAPGFDNAVDRDVLGLYLRLNYVPPPFAIYRGVFKVPPGCMIVLDERALDRPPAAPPWPEATGILPGLACRRYWSTDPVLAERAAAPEPTVAEALAALERCLTDAVELQMLADVPVGAFLSGGIDSSLIVALMRQAAQADVRTFTIGFEDQRHDEADHARAVAQHLGTRHRELTVTSADAMAVIPHLPMMYDEPFADSSQIPTHLLARMARDEVTVALSGDGGDELFCGYNRYVLTRRFWSPMSRLPDRVRRGAGALVTSVSPAAWDRLGRLPLVPAMPMLGNKAHKFAGAMKSDGSLASIYAAFTEEWHAGIPLLECDPLPVRADSHLRPDLSLEEQMMRWDAESYLPADILCKVDRAAMAISLETRMPFLDHRVVEQAWRTPQSLKLRDGDGKWLLRQLLYRHVPRELVDRPKAGFGIPLGQWLSGALRDWAEDLLSRRALAAGPGFDVDAIRLKWQQHLTGSADWTAALWSVLMYQTWSRGSSE